MKKTLLLFLSIIASFANIYAQSLAVTSFERLPNDMDARVNHPLSDINGKVCAIIKVENTNTGFEFNTGTLQVQKVDPHAGEIWVYVQPGVRKMTISHPHLGILRDYKFPMPIEAATVYLMKLQSGEVKTVVTPTQQQNGYLIIESDPTGAQVWIDDIFLGETPFQKMYPLGQRIQYRIRKDLYHDEVGTVTIDKSQTRISPKLLPAYGSLIVNTTPQGATVYLDNTKCDGLTPLTLHQLPSGKHKIRAQMPMYGTASQEVEIADSKTSTVTLSLSARFAEVKINTLSNATVSIGSEKLGTGTTVAKLAEGVYEATSMLPGHRIATRQFTVEAGKDLTIDLLPEPIYGALAVESVPMGADIYIDGKQYGTTPNVISNVLIGQHEVMLKRPGSTISRQQVKVEESKTATVSANLVSGKTVTIVSPKPTTLKINGEEAGNTPIQREFTAGSYILEGPNGQTEVLQIDEKTADTYTFVNEPVKDSQINYTRFPFKLGATGKKNEIVTRSRPLLCSDGKVYVLVHKRNTEAKTSVLIGMCTYDLSTGKWTKMPNVPQLEATYSGNTKDLYYDPIFGHLGEYNQQIVWKQEGTDAYDLRDHQWLKETTLKHTIIDQKDTLTHDFGLGYYVLSKTAKNKALFSRKISDEEVSEIMKASQWIPNFSAPFNNNNKKKTFTGFNFIAPNGQTYWIVSDNYAGIKKELSKLWVAPKKDLTPLTESDVKIYRDSVGNVVLDVKGYTATLVRIAGGKYKHTKNVVVGDFYLGQTELPESLLMTALGYNPKQSQDMPYFMCFTKVNDKGNYDAQADFLAPVQMYGKFLESIANASGLRFSLPTQEQWQYAATNGELKIKSKHIGSDNLDPMTWYKYTANGKVQAMKTKQPNHLGLYDMGGNVWEYVTGKHYFDSEPKPYAIGGDVNSGEYFLEIPGKSTFEPKGRLHTIDDWWINKRANDTNNSTSDYNIGFRLCIDAAQLDAYLAEKGI